MSRASRLSVFRKGFPKRIRLSIRIAFPPLYIVLVRPSIVDLNAPKSLTVLRAQTSIHSHLKERDGAHETKPTRITLYHRVFILENSEPGFSERCDLDRIKSSSIDPCKRLVLALKVLRDKPLKVRFPRSEVTSVLTAVIPGHGGIDNHRR